MKTMAKTIDVTGLGEAMVEFNQTIAGRVEYRQGFGGDTSNAVIAAARAGARTAYLTRLGQDQFGLMLLDLWRREAVDCSAIVQDTEAATGIYFVSHDATGHAFSYLRANSAASRMNPAWLVSSAVKGAIEASKILHVSGISLAISASACETVFAALQIARDANTLVSLDSNLRLKLWPLARAQACIQQAMEHCDIFLPGLDDMQVLTGLTDADAIVDWSHAHGALQVALKLGDQGVLVSDGKSRQRIAPIRVQCVDATGAGDCFGGNLLARIAQGEPLVEAARYANAAAALAVQGFGAVDPLPTTRQVLELLGGQAAQTPSPPTAKNLA